MIVNLLYILLRQGLCKVIGMSIPDQERKKLPNTNFNDDVIKHTLLLMDFTDGLMNEVIILIKTVCLLSCT